MLAIETTSLLPSRRRRANKRCKLAKASLAGEGQDEGECRVVGTKDAPNNNRYEFGMSLGLMV